jgi:hypothetical protein
MMWTMAGLTLVTLIGATVPRTIPITGFDTSGMLREE